MADTLERLQQLQAVDLRLFRSRKELAAKPEELQAAEIKLEAQRQTLKKAEDALKAEQLAQKEREVDLQTREGQVNKLQGQLLQLKTNKEYQAMQHEIDSLKADNSLIEEDVIRAFDKVEAASRRRAEEQAKMKNIEAAAQADRDRIRKEMEDIEARIAQLERDRKTLEPDVPAEALELYNRLSQGRYGRQRGQVIFPVVDETCGACHQRLLPQTLNRVMLGADLVVCDCGSCILYMPDNE